MPPKKIGEGAQARYDKKRPVVGFRVPSTQWKEQLALAAKEAGQTIGEYVQEAVHRRMYPVNPKKSEGLKRTTIESTTEGVKERISGMVQDPDEVRRTLEEAGKIDWDQFDDLS